MHKGILICAIAVFCLVGCGQADNSTPTDTAEPTPSVQPPEPVVQVDPNAKFDPAYQTQMRQQLQELWQQLQGWQHNNATFHQFIFSTNSFGGQWDLKRQTLQTEWNRYLDSLPGPERVKADRKLTSSFYKLYAVGLSWGRTQRRGSDQTEINIGDLRKALSIDS